ncbi:MAG: PE family protein [Mycobacterium sp.]|nr:MAG: PE family protein [Mycobacterium sp.]
MSYVIAAAGFVHSAAGDLASIGSSLAEATATVAGPTTAIAAAAQDEVSTALAALFGDFGRQFQALSTQAQAFHTQFVSDLQSSAAAYAGAESANAQQVLATGISTGLRQLATNPATFLGNLQTAAQSVFLIGAPQDVASAVVQRTLGGVTQATNGSVTPPEVVPVNDVHVQLYEGLVGLADFQTGSTLESAFVTGLTNLAASPASGVLLGAIGPFVSPGVALWNSAGSIVADLTGGAPAAALGHLLDTPARVADAFCNGATLNLDPLAPIFGPFVTAGSAGGERLDGLSYAFGGLFSPGQVVSGASGPLYYGTGGSMLNALGLEFSFYPPDDFAGGALSIPPIPVGPIGATAGLLSILGHALGGTL